jgi:capsular polysaccharide biosynthesis protein
MLHLRLAGNWTSLPGRLDEGYWHFLLDSIPRLHALDRFPDDTRVLIRPRPEPWMIEIYEMLGVRDRLVEADFSCAEVEHYYFSSFTSMTGACNPFAVRFLRDRLLHHSSVENPADSSDNAAREPLRLFLQRGDDWTRGILNRENVWRLAESKGWMLVQPEQLSIREQIALFAKADAVCAMHGAALTNSLWMTPGTTMIALTADDFLLGGFEWLARCLDMHHHALICPGDSRFRIRVDLEQLDRLLDAVQSLKREKHGIWRRG